MFSKSHAQHLQHLQTVLLDRHKLYAKLSKCSFLQTEVQFLGHVASAEGVKVDPAIVTAISEWKEPHNSKELRSFLGFANYFRRFMQGYSNMVAPLTALLRKETDFVWSDRCQTAFETVKYALTHAPVKTGGPCLA